MYASGLRGAALEKQLQKDALAATGLGKHASAADIEALMIQPAMQAQKFQEALAHIFSGVKVEPFLKAMQTVLAIFDENAASGKALKALVEVILNPLFSAAAKIGPYVKNVFRGMVVAALIVAITVLRVRNAISSILPASAKSNIDWLKISFYAGIVVAGLFTLALIVLTGILLFAAAAFFILNIPLMIVVALLAILVASFLAIPIAIILVIAYFHEIVAWLGTMASCAILAGVSMAQGLANGIASSAGAVYDAIKAMAAGAIGTLKSALGIASPSKVFEFAGKMSAKGMEGGVDTGSSGVNDAVANMVSIPSSAGTSPTQATGGKSATINVNVQAPSKQAHDEAVSLYRPICEAIEEAAHSAGINLELAVT